MPSPHIHDLVAWRSEGRARSWSCDICGVAKATRYGCDFCDYDECSDCVRQTKSTVRFSRPQHAHPLTIVPARLAQNWYCDVCRATGTGSDRFSCARCDYDECRACVKASGSPISVADTVVRRARGTGRYYCGVNSVAGVGCALCGSGACGPEKGCSCAVCDDLNRLLRIPPEHHPHPLRHNVGDNGAPWFCDSCEKNSTGKPRFRCARGCDYDVCGSCLRRRVLATDAAATAGRRLYPTLMNGAGAIVTLRGERFCCSGAVPAGAQARQCGVCRGRCGFHVGCDCTSCRSLNAVLALPPRDGVSSSATPTLMVPSSGTQMQRRGSAEPPKAGGGQIRMAPTASANNRPSAAALAQANQALLAMASQMANRFVGCPIFLCTECACITFAICSTHRVFLCHHEVYGSSCPISGCTSAARANGGDKTCKSCDQPNALQYSYLQLSGKEVIFTSNAMLKEKLDLIPMICLVCDTCHATEFPGFRDVLVNAFDVITNPIARDLLRRNVAAFTHRPGCQVDPDRKIEPLIMFLEKSLSLLMLATFVKTASLAPSKPFDPVELLFDLVVALDSLRVDNAGLGAAAGAGGGADAADADAGLHRAKVLWEVGAVDRAVRSGKLAVILFSANWCGPCKAFKPLFYKLTKEHDTVDFFIIDCYDKRLSESSRNSIINTYSVNCFPVTVIFHNGAELTRANGGGRRAVRAIENAVLDVLEEGGGGSGFLGGLSAAGGGGAGGGDAGLVMTREDNVIYKPGHEEARRATQLFLESMGGMYPRLRFRVLEVNKVHNVTARQAFEARRAQMAGSGSGGKAEAMKLFHSTHPGKVEKVCRENLSMARVGETDDGFFGRGLYFSKYVDYTFAYSHGNGMREIREGETGTTILFDVVLGRTCQLTDLKVGNGLTPGYDSHISPKQCEMVIFDNRQCVPVYTFKFKAEKALVEVMEGMNGEFWAK